MKSGGYWPGNMAKGLTNHQSTVFLFDPDTGRHVPEGDEGTFCVTPLWTGHATPCR